MTAAFADEARRFCAFIEQGGALPLAERLRQARARLLALYLAGSELQSPGETDHVEGSRDAERPESWCSFAPVDFFYLVFDPFEQDAPVGGSLSGELVEIYQDIREGLDLWNAGAHANATWAWWFGFDAHWGNHSASLIRVLHHACQRHPMVAD